MAEGWLMEAEKGGVLLEPELSKSDAESAARVMEPVMLLEANW